jgi:glutamyl-tRNA reductase
MDLVLIGASHRTASVDVRGRLAAAAAGYPAWLATHGARAMAEVVVLSTCHRVEVLACARDADEAEASIRSGLFGDAGDGSALYTRRGQDAVVHLARVASGLDSLIVGEAEISGQVRRALAAACAAGTAGPILSRVVAGALRASGRARAGTRIGAGTISAASAAVSLLEDTWGTLEDKAVLVLGAGEAARQALHRLRRRRAARLFVASRSPHHAEQAAARSGAAVTPLGDLAATLLEVDGVIAAARATGVLIDRAACAVRRRDVRIVDLSIPRVVDPAVADLAGVTLHTVDDLGDIVRESLRGREREIPRAERILIDEAGRTWRQFAGRRHRRAAVA